ncbi:MoaD/ThiS family protein [Candidatus Micrarchaeota archaeon]|nr:MoaD/ThiS family protein [Candidatus Micrarchaeota archaeon]
MKTKAYNSSSFEKAVETNISLTTNGKRKKISAKQGASVRDVMREEGVNSELVMIKLNDEIAHPSTELREGDSLEFIQIIHSG